MGRQGGLSRIAPVRVGGGPALEATSLLVVRYPSALDAPPTIEDDQTPLAGIFYNYLGLMIEAVMSELGPMAEIYRGANGTLKTFLGQEGANRISNWRSIAKTTGGGNEKGDVFGVIKFLQSFTASAWNVRRNRTITVQQGQHPDAKQPLLMSEASNPSGALSSADMIDGIGGGIRGRGQWGGASTIFTISRGAPSTAIGKNITITPSVAVHQALLYMVEAT